MNMPLVSLKDYLELVDVIGRRTGRRRGSIPSHLHPILERLGIAEHNIPEQMRGYGRYHIHMIGSPETLKRESELSGRRWKYRPETAGQLYCNSV